MPDTGYNWDDAWTFAKDEDGNDWNDRALANDTLEISNTAISLDGKAACEVGIAIDEDAAGTIDDIVTIFVLGSGGGIADEEYDKGSPWSFTITPVQNDVVYKRFSVSPAQYGSYKIAIFNEGGCELDFSVKYRLATIPLAS